MTKIKLSIDSVSDNLQILEFTGPDVLTPADLVGLKLPNANTKKGIVISGRGPVWLYAYLVHECHVFPFVATNDPRLGGFVVVQSHTPGVKPGDILPSGQ